MRSIVLSLSTLLVALCAAAPLHAQTDEQLARRIGRWFDFWRAGRVVLDEALPSPPLTARIYGRGVVPERAQQPLTHRDALALMLDRARQHQTAAVTRALLELAAVGMDGGREDPRRTPEAVRAAAQAVLARFDSPASIDALVAAASPDERDLGLRVAAVQALGGSARPVARVFVEPHLGDDQRLVRLAAAEAVAARAHPDSLDELTARIDDEEDAVVLQAVVIAAHRILRERQAEVDPGEALRATLAAIRALGRCDDWRTDLAIVELLSDARTARAIPALIEVLARFSTPASARRSSTILRDRAHRVLESLTGTRLGAANVAGWRTFWERERSGFAVAPRVERRAGAGATTTGFFGIPIRGSRIVFVIDVSGSMGADLSRAGSGTTTTAQRQTASRLTWAKRELISAVAGLPADARFGVVVFSTQVEFWGSSLLPARPSTRASLREMLGKLAPGGATNLWGALDRALGLSGAVYGYVDVEGVDEVFLLTDGQPSAGKITAPAAIVEAVRDANRYRRVRIHAVSLGGDARFLRRLAEENGGTFVMR